MFKSFLVMVGLPVGLLTTFCLVMTLGASLSLPDFLLTTILVALAMAGGLTGMTVVFLRLVTRSRRSTMGLVLMVAMATIVGGIGLLAASSAFPHGKWTRLPDPPLPLSGFAGPNCYGLNSELHPVYGTTLDGRYLSYGPTSRDGWTVESSLPTGSPEDFSPCKLSTSEIPPRMPDHVLDLHSVREIGADCGGISYFLLKTDGTVWESSRFSCAIGVVGALIIYLFLLAAIGFGGGIGSASYATIWGWNESLSEKTDRVPP